MTTDIQRDWPGDAAAHELGNYQNMCCACRQVFIGHRGRLVCKLCSAKPDTVNYKNGYEKLVEKLGCLGINARLPLMEATFREGYSCCETDREENNAPNVVADFTAFYTTVFDRAPVYANGVWDSDVSRCAWVAWNAHHSKMTAIFAHALDKAVTATVEESAKVCESRADSIAESGHNTMAVIEARKCAMAIRSVASAGYAKIRHWF